MEENQLHLPEGWEGKELGSLYLEKRKSKFKVSDATNYGGIPFYTSGDAVLEHNEIQTDGKNIFLATGGIANVKFYYGKVAYSTDTYVIVGKENIDTKFLYFKILDQLYYINTNYFQGSGLKHLQKKDFRKHLFALPKTEIEQSTIANILTKTDQAIANTEALIAKYTCIKTGLMQDLLTKGIDENGNIRAVQTHEFKDSTLGRIPKEWEVKSLLELSLKIGDGTHSSVKFSDNEEVPFLFVSCVRPNRIDWTKITSITLDEYQKISKGKEPKRGTVLYTLVGSYGNAVTLNNSDKLSFQRHIGFIETKRDILLPEFLTLFFNSIYGNLQANDLAVGNAQKTITLGALSEFKILKPSIEEQNLIIEKVSVIEKHLSQIETELSKLQSLKMGLMQDLLSGKVRVKNAKEKGGEND